jgi:ParB-like chromosome segregation protein Spo0J
VNFRVNEEEYAALVAACSENGARSISDFARLSVLGRAGRSGGRQAAGIHWRLAALGRKMAELETRVVQLLRLLEGAEDGSRGERDERAGAAG